MTVSVEDRLALSAEHRRLRFSFQINDVKDPTGLPVPPFSARWRRRAAYLVAAVFGVNRLLKKFDPVWIALNQGAKIAQGRRGGFPHQSGTSRLKLANLQSENQNGKRVLSSFCRFDAPGQGLSEARLVLAAPAGRNPKCSDF